MKKLLIAGILVLGATSFASEGKINLDRQISITSRAGESTTSEYGMSHDILADYLFLKSGNTFYGLTAGWMSNRFDDSSKINSLNKGWADNPYEKEGFNVKGVFAGATAKHYLTNNIYAKGTVGYQWGDASVDTTDEKTGYKEHVKSDMASPFATAELAYEFNNGIALGTYYKVSRVEFTSSSNIDYNKKKTNQVWGFTTGYTF